MQEILTYMRNLLSIFILIALMTTACKPKVIDETSSENRVNTFTFYEDTLNPGLTAATYKIDHSGDTGRIYSKDSLRFGTRLDSVIPYITYVATPGSATFYLPNDTIISTGIDTLNLTQKPVYLRVLASDLKSERWYRIDIDAHKIDPYLYVWQQIGKNIFPEQNCETKAFYTNGKFVLFLNNGISTEIYLSSNAEAWSKSATAIQGLPTPCQVRDILLHNDTLYYIADNQLYCSGNLHTWSSTDYSSAQFEPINMLLSYDEMAWCLLQERTTKRLMLGIVKGGLIEPMTDLQGMEDGYLPTHFPISDFAALQFESSSERPRAMIVGGRAINGSPVNSRWNLEHVITETGYRIKDFTISQSTFHTLTGAAIVQYGGKLVMFGGIDNNLDWNSDILYSDDEGMHWYLPDTSQNKMPEDYITRQYPSVIHLNNCLYVIGGSSQNSTLRDVYKGQLNSLR